MSVEMYQWAVVAGVLALLGQLALTALATRRYLHWRTRARQLSGALEGATLALKESRRQADKLAQRIREMQGTPFDGLHTKGTRR